MATKTPTTTATATVVEVKGGEEIGKKSASLFVFFGPETASYFIGMELFSLFLVRLLTSSGV